MTERDVIEILTQGFPRAPEQVNAVHEADAELIRIGSELWAVTVDDFSPEEDLFFDAPPWLIGWNVAAATLSDLLCVGADPRFFLPAVSLSSEQTEDFLLELSRGVRDALEKAGCFLIGGDVGRADQWRYVGTAMGPVRRATPLTRRIPEGRHSIWVSGPLGGANVAAARSRRPPRFPLHIGLAKTIRGVASACIDTSGGFCDALWAMGLATPGVRIEIQGSALPLAPEVHSFGVAHGIPPEAALLGGAGEYELLFSVPDGASESVIHRIESSGCSKVGYTATDPVGGVFFRRKDDQAVRLPGPPPCPRSAKSAEIHMEEVASMARDIFS